MRYYVEINGNSSLDIEGLAIKELPPITKPLIRSQIEEIDGRDGDIITELGYSAYDKSIEIGLYGSFDIDAIIKYFTGEGTITFSNEPDKFYYFKLLNQIDYEKLLKFKTAVVTFHCQPFKYPVEETPIEGEATEITGSGSNITLENTVVAPMDMKLKGNTIQEGTPTPSSPIPVQVVSGDNSIKVEGKNLCNGINQDIFLNNAVNSCGISSGNSGLCIPVNSGNYTISTTATQERYRVACVINNPITSLTSQTTYNGVKKDNTSDSITINTTGYSYLVVNATDLSKIQIEKGSEPTTYEEYKSASYSISLGVENLIDLNHIQPQNSYATVSLIENGVRIKTVSGGYAGRIVIDNLKQNTDYYLSYNWKNISNGENKVYVFAGTTASTTLTTFAGTNSTGGTFNTGANSTINIWFYAKTNEVGEVEYTNIQLEKGTIKHSYTPSWKSPIELNKIGTYQDKIFKNTPNTTDYNSELEDNVWYLKKEIGKVVLNGSEEGWINEGGGAPFKLPLDNIYRNNSIAGLCSNYYIGVSYSSNWNTYNYLVSTNQANATIPGIKFRNTDITSLSDWKTWLSTHNTIVYYAMATPTYTIIEDTTLISQLEALKPYSYNPVTNITQTNDDAPFELDVSLSYTNTMNVNNVGNIYAKPILTIEGSGTIGIILNDIEVLSVDLGTDEKITIDVPNLQAYNPDNDVLLNRNVTGDYMKLLINDGDNTIAFSGSVTRASLTNYIRWI